MTPVDAGQAALLAERAEVGFEVRDHDQLVVLVAGDRYLPAAERADNFQSLGI